MVEWRGAPSGGVTLTDILDRVLDKGLVLAGDIRISLANIELLTIQIRLLVCSIDKAAEIGLDWWRHDSFLSAGAQQQAEEIAALRTRLAELEQQLAALPEQQSPSTRQVRRETQTGG
jgi:hypothetical protein